MPAALATDPTLADDARMTRWPPAFRPPRCYTDSRDMTRDGTLPITHPPASPQAHPLARVCIECKISTYRHRDLPMLCVGCTCLTVLCIGCKEPTHPAVNVSRCCIRCKAVRCRSGPGWEWPGVGVARGGMQSGPVPDRPEVGVARGGSGPAGISRRCPLARCPRPSRSLLGGLWHVPAAHPHEPIRAPRAGARRQRSTATPPRTRHRRRPT